MKRRIVSKNKNGIILSIIVVVLILILVSIFFMTRKITDYETVVYVNDLPISYGEYMLISGEKRGETTAFFYENYHIDENVDFWSKEAEFGGKNPLEEHKKSVLDSLIQIKLEQQLMIEYGIVSEKDITYQTFLKFFEEENRNRRLTIEQNGVVYGPEQYTEIGYYHYLHENRLQQLRDAMYVESENTDVEDKFTNKLIDKKINSMLKTVEVNVVSNVYEDIKAFE